MAGCRRDQRVRQRLGPAFRHALHPARRSGKRPAHLPFGGAPANATTTVDLKLPDYQLVNLSAGVKFDSELSLTAYVNNLFDENPLLSFDRERGGRARLGFSVGQPRTFGVTARKEF